MQNSEFGPKLKKLNSKIMAKQPDWAIIYFKNFWALIEGEQVPEEVEKPELDWTLLGLLDFWAMTGDEDGGDAQEEDDDLEPRPESGSESDDSSEDGLISSDMDHLARMWVLKAENRYLLRTIELQEKFLDDQARRLKEHKMATKARMLEIKELARARKKREKARCHKILGSFAQFWTHIERQEARGEEPIHLEDAEGFFRLFPSSM